MLSMELQKNKPYVLSFDEDFSVKCDSGLIWLTLQDFDRDFVFYKGEGESFKRNERVVVFALEKSKVHLYFRRLEPQPSYKCSCSLKTTGI